MTTIDKSGVSVEEIIRTFRREHNIKDHELKYEILKKPSKGFFGLFANKSALVRFQLPENEDRIRLFTESLLCKMGISFSDITSKKEGKTLFLTVNGIVETGFIIGKNGTMLETIQYLINRVFEGDRTIDRIYLDADGYRQRRESQFLSKFLPRINQIKTSGNSLTLEPMSPGERRIIHRHIEKDKGLKTLTIGEGENKRIVVFSAKMKESEVLQQNGKAKNESGEAKPDENKAKPSPRHHRAPQKKRDTDQNSPDKSTSAETYPIPSVPKKRSPRKPDYRNRKPRPKTENGDK
ncbi:MAG: Jag N-terminal domain-containing protein [Candidatus Cloacimonetes bacterium]|jgi:spoIIIJ-associated protein|nr:Jag N-terminal domain-containing protein [Candidatus Cloacimonadota bacterium]MDD2506358.1 Jag N-terminal domain-containing protein [Candidatus Cloacimonadota bacterium]MDD4147929.1 Jag N-terminal domain-containing protein [Candidatus Cloacimonadota bacterium]